MNNGLIALRYATALLDYSKTASIQDRIYQEAKTVAQSITEVKALRTTLSNPVLAYAQKKEIILLAAGSKVSDQFNRFVDLLLVNKRELFLQTILLKFIDLYRKQNNIYAAKIVTAVEMDASTELKITSLLKESTGGIIEVSKSVDSSILGGFLVEIDFNRWNASISAQLEKLRLDYIEINKSIL